MIKIKYFYVLSVCNFSKSGTELVYAVPGDILKFDENDNLFIYSVLGVPKGHINNFEGFSNSLLSKLVDNGYIIESPAVPSILASIDISTSNADSVLVNPTPGTNPPQGFGYTNAIAIDPSNGKFYGPRDPEQWQLSTLKFFIVSDTPQDGMGGEARIALNENTKTFWYRDPPYLNQLMNYSQGNGVPDNNNGALDGTYYIDLDTMLVYGPKTNGIYINVSRDPARYFDSSVSTPNWYNGDLPSWPYAGVFFFDTFTGSLYNNTGGTFTTATPTIIVGSIVTSSIPMEPNVTLSSDFDTFGTYGDVLVDRVNMVMARPKGGASWPEMPIATYITHNLLSGRDATDSHPMSAITGLDANITNLNNVTSPYDIYKRSVILPSNPALSQQPGSNNYILGYNAGASMTTASYNAMIGMNTGAGIITGNNNVIIGDNAGATTVPGQSFSVSIGSQARATNSYGVAIGYRAVANVGASNQSIAIGIDSSAGDNSISIGAGLGTKTDSIAIGGGTSIGDMSISLGLAAGTSAAVGSIHSIFIGNYAGMGMTPNPTGSFIVDSYGRGTDGSGMGRVSGPDMGAILYGHMDFDETKQFLKVNGLLAAGRYLVESLPTGKEGYMAFASNGRKTGETAGAGTGVPVYFSNGLWRNIFDNLVVQA